MIILIAVSAGVADGVAVSAAVWARRAQKNTDLLIDAVLRILRDCDPER